MVLVTNDSRNELLGMSITDLIEYFDDVSETAAKMKQQEAR